MLMTSWKIINCFKALAHYKESHNKFSIKIVAKMVAHKKNRGKNRHSCYQKLQCVWTITTFLQFQLQYSRSFMVQLSIQHTSLIREEYLIIQMRFQSNDELFASVCREPLPNILHHSSQSFIIAQCCESIQSEMLYKAYTLVQSNHNLTTFSITQSYSLLLSVSGLLTDSVQLTLFLDYYNQV